MSEIWSRASRFSGKNAEIIEQCLEACEDKRGMAVLVHAMVWLAIPLERRSAFWDAKCSRLVNVPPIPSSVPEEGFEADAERVLCDLAKTLPDSKTQWWWDGGWRIHAILNGAIYHLRYGPYLLVERSAARDWWTAQGWEL